MRPEKPECFNGKHDAALVENFLYKCELYFALTNIVADNAKVGFATLLLQGDASVWLRTKYTPA